MATKKPVKTSATPEQDVYIKQEAQSILSELESRVKINAVSFTHEDRAHSGLLCLDLMMGGGIAPGFYVFAGPEQSTKTTAAITIAGATSIYDDIKIKVLWDAENSSGNSLDYVANIFETQGFKTDVDQLFGVRDDKGGWAIPPKVYYRDESSGDTFYNWVYGLQKRLPDKRYDNGSWWYVYDDTKENKAKHAERIDRRQTQNNEGLWVKAKDSSLQALIIVDSFPSLVPSAMDEDEGSNAMAVQARMHSKHLPRIKGAFRAKRIALIGINQIRLNPGARFSNPEYEPGGQALGFFCFGPNTLLLTNKGLLTAEEMYHTPAKKMLGEHGFETPQVFDKTGYSELLTVYTKSGYKMSGKPGHHVKVYRPFNADVAFKSLADLRAFHRTSYVAVKVGGVTHKDRPLKLNFVPTVPGLKFNNAHSDVRIPSVMTTSLAWIIGVLVGDGNVRDGSVGLACTSKEVKAQYLKLFGTVFNVVPGTSATGAGVYSREISDFLNYLGAGSKSAWQKNVPWSIRHAGPNCWKAFIAGLFDSDFTADRSTLGLSTVSATLADQVHVMALALGYPTSSGNLKESWWAHGANGRKSFTNETPLTSNEVLDKHRLRCPAISWFGETASHLLEELKPYLANLDRYSNFSEGTRDDLTPKWRILPIEKFTSEKKEGGPWMHKVLSLYEEVTCKKRTAIDTWDTSWCGAAREIANTYRTKQERKKILEGLDKLEAFMEYSRENSLVWHKIDSVTSEHERTMTYDGCMPETHTIVTSGIVSHNSDVRFRFFRRSSGMPFNPKIDKQVEVEKSINGGEDHYGYIHVGVKKNKLSAHIKEMWLRLWVSDEDGVARGYCPVWDTFYFLHQTGQLSGNRKAMKLNVKGLGEATKALSWHEFKLLILGSKEQSKPIFEKIGYRAVNLRAGCLKQIQKGVARDMYFENLSKAKPKEEDED